MTFTETPLAGAFVIEFDRLADERGFFARSFCVADFAARGLSTVWDQCSVSFNEARGTLRGLHYQAAPFEEDKLVRCTAGAVYDVIVDVRTGSPTYAGWFGIDLSAENRRSLYIPKGFAHGFLSLVAASEVYYMISEPYAREAARGYRWDEPAFGIRWPGQPDVISARDAAFPLLGAS